ncbi:archaea-specific SMC-related protein [Halarchaeum salinum]|uniref:AAA family ATPase n=1 Tax=Halarchaeum salinum TaxID=489912 RepID=A0AAV3S9Y4_9EURY
MQTSRETGTGVDVHVSNIGGIDETALRLTPGVNVLVGRNATNRTSFLQSLMAVSGSERATLKGDSEEGRVEVDLDGETYTRVLTRRGNDVDFSGDPILDDAEVADLFAFLLEDNEARRAVATQGNLRELVMRPVDTEAINDRIDELVAERDRIDDEIEDAKAAGRRIPDLEERRVELLDEIEAKREALEEKQAAIDDADADVDKSREERDDLEAALDDLNEQRAELDRIASRLENERSSLASVREEREDVAETLEELEGVAEDRADYLDEQVSTLRDRKRDLDSTITQLQSLIQFNEEMLEGEHTEVLQLLADDGEGGTDAVTDALLSGTEHASGRCWTCGSEVSMEEIEETLDTLRELAREKRQERSSVTDELESVQSERNEIETRVERREELQQRLESLGEEAESREENVERLTTEREEAAGAVEKLEETVEELEAGRHSAVLDLHREANELQFELNDLQDELEDVESEIAELEAEVDRQSELTEKRETLTDELAELRTRIERLETEAVESFNDHMEAVLDVLDYGNVSRVWIERATEQVREGRRKVERTAFRLHVVRMGTDGTAYEDTVDHLSESEREVIGLVFGLAGYLVHEVYEECPFMLLDSLEAIDSNRIAALVDHFREYAPYIAVALLPEDAQALDDDYRRVSEI